MSGPAVLNPQRYEVVGGADKGGIVVRAGRDLKSPEAATRLAVGAIVQEIARYGDRVHFRKIAGDGPNEGWVSTRLKDKVLLEARAPEQPAQPAWSTPVPPVQAPQPKVLPKWNAKQPGQPAVPPPTPATSSPSPSPTSPKSPWQAKETGNPAASYPERLAALSEEYAHLFESSDFQVPYEAYSWSPEELDNFFQSGGFIKPTRFNKQQASQPKPKPASSGSSSPQSPSSPKRRPPKDDTPKLPQFSNVEAKKLQDELHKAFADKDFQQHLRNLHGNFPDRKTRGHTDGILFFDAFEALALTVYSKVLPGVGLPGDWDGVRDMQAKMQHAMLDRSVKKEHEEINTLLGLPRDAILKPTKKSEEPAFTFCPKTDGPISGYPRSLERDEDGDEGHEFFVEDPETGELKMEGPSALDADCFFRVVSKPSVPLRLAPEAKAPTVGKKLTGELARVQRIVDQKWLLLHEAELRKLGLKGEAWIDADGVERVR